MAPPEPEDHHILVVTATAAMERAPLHSTEAKERALAMALLHPMVAMEAPHQDMARIPATARAPAMARVPAMEAPLLTQAMAHPLLARPLAMVRPPDMERAPTARDQATGPQLTVLILRTLTVTARPPDMARAPTPNHPIAAVSAATATVMTQHTEQSHN